MIQQIKQSVENDPWPWIMRGTISAMTLSIAITGYLAKMAIDDIKGTASATLLRVEQINERVFENNREICLQKQRLDALVNSLSKS